MRLALLCLSTLFWLVACAAPHPARPPHPTASPETSPALAADEPFPTLPQPVEATAPTPQVTLAAAAPEIAPAKPTLPDVYQVSSGETLWMIAARKEIYGDPLLWPLLYRANRDQIKDPRQVYPGQTLRVPRRSTPEELNEVRSAASKSDIFPLEQLLKSTPGQSR